MYGIRSLAIFLKRITEAVRDVAIVSSFLEEEAMFAWDDHISIFYFWSF